MNLNLIQSTPLELITASFPEIVLAVVTQTVTYAELEAFEKELKEKQEKRLEKCKYIDGSYRCRKCGSSINENGETCLLLVDKKTRELTGTSCSITNILYCEGCEKAPPMYSSVGVLRDKKRMPARKLEIIAGRIQKLG
ncbi:MAG: hypothetical protein WD552_01625 [Candidatus Paceibacterota bacterium]